MLNPQSGLFEVISDSGDFVPGELPNPTEILNLQEPCYFHDKMSTAELSVNIINMDKAFNDIFPFIKPILPLEENDNKPIFFKTKKVLKRGRKKSVNVDINSHKPKRKIHCKTDDDNVLIKIQVHFLTFLINITNDVIEPYFQAKKKNIYFRQINYDYKKNITIDHISELKSCAIKDILQKEISPKCRNYGKDYNNNNYDYILEQINKDKELNLINNFFNMKYLEIFEKYYYTYNKKNYFYFQDKKINFSKKTKTFYNLLEKNKNDQEIQECFKKISERYLNRPKQQQSQKIFSISKNQ